MPSPAGRPITKAQIRAVHAALSGRGIDDETYRALLQAEWKATSCLDLDSGQASDLLRRLGVARKRSPTADRQRPGPTAGGQQSAPPPPPRKPPRLPPGLLRMATPKQRRLIGELRSEIEWRAGADGYRLWLKHSLGIERVASSGQAIRVIEGLKGLKRSRDEAQA